MVLTMQEQQLSIEQVPGIVPKVPRARTLLTFMGHTVHRPLIRGVKGGEGAAG